MNSRRRKERASCWSRPSRRSNCRSRVRNSCWCGSAIEQAGGWGVGRAGMEYRDLIPGRLGGRFVASQIRIRDGGPVADWVHYHRIRFQMIYCLKGWVRLVYEDQGEPFILNEGDCVLQPPEIRHRVLESSPGLEVIEIGCPAVHETYADHAMTLPTPASAARPAFRWAVVWRPALCPSYGGVRDLVALAPRWIRGARYGHCGATGGLASVRVVRPVAGRSGAASVSHQGEFQFVFVLKGALDAGRKRTWPPPVERGRLLCDPRGPARLRPSPASNARRDAASRLPLASRCRPQEAADGGSSPAYAHDCHFRSGLEPGPYFFPVSFSYRARVAASAG